MQIIKPINNIALSLLFALAIPALADDAPLHISQADALKAVKSKTAPDYSTIARQLHLEGTVEAEVVIGQTGSVDSVEPAAGNPVLFQCVRTAVKQWKFAPFTADGKPVSATARLSFAFKLH
jgi:TonB family protein